MQSLVEVLCNRQLKVPYAKEPRNTEYLAPWAGPSKPRVPSEHRPNEEAGYVQ